MWDEYASSEAAAAAARSARKQAASSSLKKRLAGKRKKLVEEEQQQQQQAKREAEERQTAQAPIEVKQEDFKNLREIINSYTLEYYKERIKSILKNNYKEDIKIFYIIPYIRRYGKIVEISNVELHKEGDASHTKIKISPGRFEEILNYIKDYEQSDLIKADPGHFKSDIERIINENKFTVLLPVMFLVNVFKTFIDKFFQDLKDSIFVEESEGTVDIKEIEKVLKGGISNLDRLKEIKPVPKETIPGQGGNVSEDELLQAFERLGKGDDGLSPMTETGALSEELAETENSEEFGDNLIEIAVKNDNVDNYDELGKLLGVDFGKRAPHDEDVEEYEVSKGPVESETKLNMSGPGGQAYRKWLAEHKPQFNVEKASDDELRASYDEWRTEEDDRGVGFDGADGNNAGDGNDTEDEDAEDDGAKDGDGAAAPTDKGIAAQPPVENSKPTPPPPRPEHRPQRDGEEVASEEELKDLGEVITMVAFMDLYKVIEKVKGYFKRDMYWNNRDIPHPDPSKLLPPNKLFWHEGRDKLVENMENKEKKEYHLNQSQRWESLIQFLIDPRRSDLNRKKLPRSSEIVVGKKLMDIGLFTPKSDSPPEPNNFQKVIKSFGSSENSKLNRLINIFTGDRPILNTTTSSGETYNYMDKGGEGWDKDFSLLVETPKGPGSVAYMKLINAPFVTTGTNVLVQQSLENTDAHRYYISFIKLYTIIYNIMNGDDILNPKELIVNAIQGKKKVHIENDVIKRHFKTLKNGGKMAEDFSKILDAIKENLEGIDDTRVFQTNSRELATLNEIREFLKHAPASFKEGATAKFRETIKKKRVAEALSTSNVESDQ